MLRRNAAAIAQDQLNQQGANIVAMGPDQLFDRVRIIDRCHVEQSLRYRRYAFAVRQYLRITACGIPVFDFRVPHHFIEKTVVATFKLDVSFPARECTRDSERGHHGFGARVGKSHEFRRRYHFADTAGDVVFELRR